MWMPSSILGILSMLELLSEIRPDSEAPVNLYLFLVIPGRVCIRVYTLGQSLASNSIDIYIGAGFTIARKHC